MREQQRGDPELVRRVLRPVVADRAIGWLHRMIEAERTIEARTRRIGWIGFAIGLAVLAVAWLYFR